MRNDVLHTVTRALLMLSLGTLVACGPTPEEHPEEIGLETRSSALGIAGQGFAWIDQYSASVSPSYSYNSSGGAVTYTSTPPGNYLVRFAGLGRSEGNAHVVSYGSTPERCRIDYWGPSGNDLVISVSCHQPSGTLANSSFVVTYNNQFGVTQPTFPRGAYLWTSSLSGTVGAAQYQWNDSGGTNTVTRTAGSPAGRYTVTLPGMNFSNASVHVTAYGGTGAQHCKVLSWGASTSATVSVGCYDAAGNLADSQFTLSYTRESLFNFHIGGHAWISSPTMAPSSYQKLAPEFSCGTPGAVSVSKPATDYVVNFTQVYRSYDSSVMVTGYGSTSDYCKVVAWGGGAASNDVNVYVRCFDKNGIATTAPFNVTYTSRYWVGPC